MSKDDKNSTRTAMIGCIAMVAAAAITGFFALIVALPTLVPFLRSLANQTPISPISPEPPSNNFISTPSITTSPPSSDTNIIFSDDFSDNRNNWDLTGTTRLSQGKLVVSVTNNYAILFFPGVNATSPNLSVQADMLLENQGNCDQSLGFILGNQDINYHTFVIINTCDGMGFLHSFDAFYDNQLELFRTEIKENKPDLRKPHKFRLDIIDGIITLYYDGIPTDSQQITLYGGNVGFYINNPQSGENVYSFDNLRVFENP